MMTAEGRLREAYEYLATIFLKFAAVARKTACVRQLRD